MNPRKETPKASPLRWPVIALVMLQFSLTAWPSRTQAAPAKAELSCAPRLANLSTRAWVDAGERALIGGFIVADAEIDLVLRALGPSLAAKGVASALDNPSLEVFRDGQRLAGLDDGVQGAADWASGLAPADPREPAIALRLPPGEYTAVVRGRSPGVALIELFQTAGEGRLGNLSTRAWVGAGEAVPIGGLIIKGAPQVVLLRAMGPSLAGRGIEAPLSDPRIDLYRDGLRIAGNDSWTQFASQDFAATQIGETGLGPETEEAAMLLRLEPGAYTVVLKGADGGEGVALFEAFAIPDMDRPAGADAGRPWARPVNTESMAVDLPLDLAEASGSIQNFLPLTEDRLMVYRSACEPGLSAWPGRPVDCRTRIQVLDSAPGAGFAELASRAEVNRALVNATLDAEGRRAFLLYQKAVADDGEPNGFRKDYQLVVWDLELLEPAIDSARLETAEIASRALAWTSAPTQARARLAWFGGRLLVLQEGGIHVYDLAEAPTPVWLGTIEPEARDFALRGETLVVLGDRSIIEYRMGPEDLPERVGERGVSPLAVALAVYQNSVAVASAEGLDCPGRPFGGDICNPVAAIVTAYPLPLDPTVGRSWFVSDYQRGASVGSLRALGDLLLWGDSLFDPASADARGKAGLVGRLRVFDPRGLRDPDGVALLSEFAVAPVEDGLLALGPESVHRFRFGRCRLP